MDREAGRTFGAAATRALGLAVACVVGGAALFLLTVALDLSEAGFWTLLALWLAAVGSWPLKWLHRELASSHGGHKVWRAVFGLLVLVSPALCVAWLVEAQVWLTGSDHVGMGPVALAMAAPSAALLALSARHYEVPLCEGLAVGQLWAALAWPLAASLGDVTVALSVAALVIGAVAGAVYCHRRAAGRGRRAFLPRLLGAAAGGSTGTATLGVVLLATSGWSGFF